MTVYTTWSKQETDLLYQFWGVSLKMVELAVAIFLPTPKHKYKDTCRRPNCTDTCYLTLQQCTMSIRSLNGLGTSSLLASALGRRQILLKSSVCCTQWLFSQFLPSCIMYQEQPHPAIVILHPALSPQPPENSRDPARTSGSPQILLTPPPYSQVSWRACPFACNLPASYQHQREKAHPTTGRESAQKTCLK